MRALQYIYTSWRNGGSSQKGYMIYSKSNGITDAECTAIKDVMQYRAPKELPMAPSDEEIKEKFPFSFAYFTLPGGRACVAQSTYLGRDYSGRYGNYIIYALVMDKADLSFRPTQMFAEPFIKTAMTQEELDAPSPVPPLPVLDIRHYGAVINDEELTTFLSDRDEEFAQVLACIIESRDANIPFYINDTRENLVFWAAAVQRVLPLRLALGFHFITYVGEHERLLSPRMKEQGIDFSFTGVRPDANYFNYAVECNNRRQIVLDFLGGHITKDITPSLFEEETAVSASVDFEETDDFSNFVNSTGVTEINSRLRSAYLYYAVLKKDYFDYSKDNLITVLTFGSECCSAQDNEQVGDKIISLAQEEHWEPGWEEFRLLWQFICTYTSYLVYTLYELLIGLVYRSTENGMDPDELLDELGGLRQASSQYYGEFLDFINTWDSSDQLMLHLREHRDASANLFFLRWILQNYSFPKGLDDRQPISAAARDILKNISRAPGYEKEQLEILLDTVSTPVMFESVLNAFIDNWSAHETRMDRVCDYFMSLGEERSEAVSSCVQRLCTIPKAVPIAARMSVRQIRDAKDPEKTFWELYKQRIQRNLPESRSYAASMVETCIGKLGNSDRLKAAARMVRELDQEVIGNTAVARTIIEVFEDSSVKNLLKVDDSVLKDAYHIGIDVGADSSDKLCAVAVGISVEEGNNGYVRKLSMTADIEPLDITLLEFDKADYEFYVKTFFEEYLNLVTSVKDVGTLMRLFYHGAYFNAAMSECTSILKKIHKKDIDRWDDLICWLCIYAIQTQNTAGYTLYGALVRYLKRADDEDIRAIRGSLAKHRIDKGLIDRFIGEATRKEDIGERISNIFRRK